MEISGGFCFGLAAFLLLVPLQWSVACILAALFHELCHYLAICLLAGKKPSIRVFAYVAHMPLPEMSAGREVLCALAGPVGGLLLLFVARWFPRLAICAAIQSVYNLLPIYPLDGGRALSCSLGILLPPKAAKKVCKIIEMICIAGIFCLAIYGCIWLKLGLFPLLLTMLLIIRLK